MRGIGRYVYDLLRALESVRDEWSERLDIAAVTELGWFGTGVLSRDLAGAAEDLRARRGSERDSIVKKRRMSLGAVARSADLLHLAEPIGMPLVKLSRWGVTCYDLIPLRMPQEYLGGSRVRVLRRKLEDYVLYHRADVIVAISERTRTDVVSMLSLPPDRVLHVPTGIDLPHWRAAPTSSDPEARRRGGAGARPYVLFVGEGDQRKGVATMMAAVALVRRELDIELVWVGQLPPEHLARFQKQARAAGLEGSVRFPGFVADEDLGALYRGAIAHVFLSVLEGFGLPVAEAMAAGCPVVVVRGSGCDEIAGDAGCVVPPGDAAAAARAILALARDPEDRACRVRKGSARIEVYDRKAMARGYVEAWERALR